VKGVVDEPGKTQAMIPAVIAGIDVQTGPAFFFTREGRTIICHIIINIHCFFNND
jgi:hypothetical protein